MAVVVGGAAGLGAVAFRWLIFSVTWLVTGHEQFGQQGRVPSLHLPWLGIWFVLLVPVLGGLVYGPLVDRFAKEARGHGVPEVMLAVSDNGGRIRPPVTAVKALASAICIGVGGSVGREGPIVQIGSALASSLGQVVEMSETRLRILVACGAAGGIAATFNAPITGLFFGFEIILREFSLEALLATMFSAVTADLVSRAFFGSRAFFSGVPHDLLVAHPSTYLLVALLGLCAGLVGFGFKTVLYKFEDTFDALWKGRPEWARPAVGGLALGAVLLLLPQMYGVGYPVMDRAVSGHTVLWLLVVLMLGKIVASSLTLSMGGSGGIFAPSLFIGAMAGMAFGICVEHVFGHVVSSPAMFGIVAMGAVFGATAQAPLTATASVVEMTGNFTLIVPVMLAVGIATAVSKRLSYGSIYTTKLLRRGIDIEHAQPTTMLQTVTVGDVMMPVAANRDGIGQHARVGQEITAPGELINLVGPVTGSTPTEVLYADDTLEQAVHDLARNGRLGLPVLSPNGEHIRGWVTRNSVLTSLAARADRSREGIAQGTPANALGGPATQSAFGVPLKGYEIVELTARPDAPAIGRRLDEIPWPSGSFLGTVTEQREIVPARGEQRLEPGTQIVLLVLTRTFT